MESVRRSVAIVVLGTVLLVAGCHTASHWQYARERPREKCTTVVTVHTEPEGAEITLNGNYVGESPLVVPIRYPCRVTVYERRQLLPYLHVEEREVRDYLQNEFEISAYVIGYHQTERKITLRGEESVSVEMKLREKSQFQR